MENWHGPHNPQKGVTVAGSGLPIAAETATPGRLYVLGTHGGAGEDSLADILGPGALPARHAWPNAADSAEAVPVLLCARTDWHGLRSASLAASQWGAGQVRGILMLGLVLIDDQPGKLPKPLQDLAELVKGGVPAAWRFSYYEELRLGLPGSEVKLDKQSRRTVEAVRREYTAASGLHLQEDKENTQ